MDADKWTEKKEQAALLVASDELRDVDIAARIGISERALYKWKRRPDFLSRVSEHVNAQRQAVLSRGIADMANRIRALNDRHIRLCRVIEERAEEMDGEVAGGGTGLLARDKKALRSGPLFEVVNVYRVDTGLLSEMRAIEEHVAKQMGQWTEKSLVTTNAEIVVKQIRGVSMEEL